MSREPIYTPGGLKIRLHEEGLRRVLGKIKKDLDIDDAFADVELWANFPGALSNVAAIATAVTTQSWIATLITATASFWLGGVAQHFGYSRLLKVLFPQILGGWLIAMPVALGASYYLWRLGSLGAAIVIVPIVVVNWFGISDVLLLLTLPVATVARRITGQRVGSIEIAFMRILDFQARKLGIDLNWERYNQRSKKVQSNQSKSPAKSYRKTKQSIKKPDTKSNRTDSEVILSHKEFVTRAIVRLRENNEVGIHSNRSGFNQAFLDYYGEDSTEVLNTLTEEGFIIIFPEKDGVMIYLPKDVEGEGK